MSVSLAVACITQPQHNVISTGQDVEITPKKRAIGIMAVGLLWSPVAVRQALRCALGVVDGLRLREAAPAVRVALEEAWAPGGRLLVPVSANRARHPAAQALGLLEQPLGELPLSAVRAVCMAAARRAMLCSDGQTCRGAIHLTDTELNERSKSAESVISEWLLTGCCTLYHHPGLGVSDLPL